MYLLDVPEPSLLQVEQSLFSQLFLIGEVLHPFIVFVVLH